MSWDSWNRYYFERGKEDFKNGENNPPEDNLVLHPGIADFDGGPMFTITDAQSAYTAGRSEAGAEAAEED